MDGEVGPLVLGREGGRGEGGREGGGREGEGGRGQGGGGRRREEGGREEGGTGGREGGREGGGRRGGREEGGEGGGGREREERREGEGEGGGGGREGGEEEGGRASTITTIERRFGLSSFSSGTISSLHEVGNTVLIVFVSYLGSRVHRPRLIGLGGLLMSISALILALPHFLSQPYEYDSAIHDRQDLCSLQGTSNGTEACGKAETKRIADTNNLWLLMAIAQLLFGVGSVPIQPFGISYVDDFAGQGNSPLYIGSMWTWTEPAQACGTDIQNEDSKKPEFSLLDFLKIIAGLATFLTKFLERQYSTTAAYSSLLIGQYSTTAAYSSLLIGAVNLPSVAVGMLVGGVIMKRTGLSLKTIPRFSVAMLSISVLLLIPLFFMGCPTQRVAKVNYTPHGFLATCYSNCSCPANAFNPVCGSDNTEYLSPCHAGCKEYTKDPKNKFRVLEYTDCICIGHSQRTARPGPCPNQCPHFLLPVMFIISLAGMIASLTHNPIYMMVLRTVPHEDKSFAIGVQFLLLRVLAWLPAPALFGIAIDSSCIWWKHACGNRLGCGYYDNTILRNRYLGLQMGFKVMGIFLLGVVGWKVQRTREYSLEKRPDGPL
ncbi:unnamed protein product [Coregonus sp. 'balchen']|nr:unnamed protein product [Coregonus sp. 'balchen']